MCACASVCIHECLFEYVCMYVRMCWYVYPCKASITLHCVNFILFLIRRRLWPYLCQQFCLGLPEIVLTGVDCMYSSWWYFTFWHCTQGHREYYQAELDLNAKLRTFAVNCSLLYGGHNTVQAQLKFKSKRRQCGCHVLLSLSSLCCYGTRQFLISNLTTTFMAQVTSNRWLSELNWFLIFIY